MRKAADSQELINGVFVAYHKEQQERPNEKGVKTSWTECW